MLSLLFSCYRTRNIFPRRVLCYLPSRDIVNHCESLWNTLISQYFQYSSCYSTWVNRYIICPSFGLPVSQWNYTKSYFWNSCKYQLMFSYFANMFQTFSFSMVAYSMSYRKQYKLSRTARISGYQCFQKIRNRDRLYNV